MRLAPLKDFVAASLLVVAAIPLCADETPNYAEQERKRIEARMALRVQDPVKEYYQDWCCGGNAQDFKGDKYLFQIIYDLNADGRKDMLLSMNFLDNGRAGTMWEIYLAGKDGYRWIESFLTLEGRMLKAGVWKPLGKDILVSYWHDTASQGLWHGIYVENDKVVSVKIGRSDSDKDIWPDMTGLEDINETVIPFEELEEKYGYGEAAHAAFFKWLGDALASPEEVNKRYEELIKVGFETGLQDVVWQHGRFDFKVPNGPKPRRPTRAEWTLLCMADFFRTNADDLAIQPLAADFETRMLNVLERKVVPPTFPRSYAMLFLSRAYVSHDLLVRSARDANALERIATSYSRDSDMELRMFAFRALEAIAYNDMSRATQIESLVGEFVDLAPKNEEWREFVQEVAHSLTTVEKYRDDVVDEPFLVSMDKMSVDDLFALVAGPHRGAAMRAVERLTADWMQTTLYFARLLALVDTSKAGYEILQKLALPIPESASASEKENWDLLARSIVTLPSEAVQDLAESPDSNPRMALLLRISAPWSLKRAHPELIGTYPDPPVYGMDQVRDQIAAFILDSNSPRPEVADIVSRITGPGIQHHKLLFALKPAIDALHNRLAEQTQQESGTDDPQLTAVINEAKRQIKIIELLAEIHQVSAELRLAQDKKFSDEKQQPYRDRVKELETELRVVRANATFDKQLGK